MKRFFCFILAFGITALSTICMVACNEKPEVPEQLATTAYEEPILNVYNTSTQRVEEMKMEDYLLGVVAGEMHNDWPMEALKAQAILARTYTLHFIKERGKSKYKGADISTDISEAQAYNSKSVNDNVRKAVKETRGRVVAHDGEFAYTWFHSNSGGKTSTTREGFNNTGEEPEFIKVAKSPENESNSQSAVWSYSFSKAEVLSALSKMKVSVSNVSSASIGEKGESGRALTLIIGGKEVSAADFRLAIGSTLLKSTYITAVYVSQTTVYFEGKGYGHGVGLSQWGAKVMAEQGKKADEIVKHYYKDIGLYKLY